MLGDALEQLPVDGVVPEAQVGPLLEDGCEGIDGVGLQRDMPSPAGGLGVKVAEPLVDIVANRDRRDGVDLLEPRKQVCSADVVRFVEDDDIGPVGNLSEFVADVVDGRGVVGVAAAGMLAHEVAADGARRLAETLNVRRADVGLEAEVVDLALRERGFPDAAGFRDDDVGRRVPPDRWPQRSGQLLLFVVAALKTARHPPISKYRLVPQHSPTCGRMGY